MSDIASLRKEYTNAGLLESDVVADPIEQFDRWFSQAIAAGIREPNAMTLATVADGQPAARIVLLKSFDAAGFVFYTNRQSQKGQELAANPRAALVFYWTDLERQVRIVGTTEAVSDAESDAYFASRPAGARIGAWASAQSTVLAGRAELEARVADITARFADGAIPRPPHWGGYRVVPTAVEFWQGRVSRLHDRLVYQRQATGWSLERRAP
ncbi:MAG: pyridoxamine 5'-phosphate oxidase [Chloroflexi bacterium]|nr:pyridoxamine 5'-phosphate oxidase [Chloroflexota bacterium]